MNPNYTPTENSNRKQLLVWVATAALAVIVLGIVVSWLLSVNAPQRSLSKTPFTTQNFSQLIGSDIYSYDGLVFTKTNITTHETTILSRGVKLPEPTTVTWAGSRGVLMNFRESFILSQVESELFASGQEVDDTTMDYTWFFDFKDSSLHKVSNLPVVGGYAVYSEAEKGFYYVANIGEEEGGDVFTAPKYPLHFYNIETGSSIVITEDLKLASLSYLGTCPDQKYVACVGGREESSPSKLGLYGVSRDSSKTKLLESSGRLVPTNSPGLFITTEQPSAQTSAEEDADYSETPAKLRNLKDGTTTDLKFTLAGQLVFPYVNSKDDYFALMANQINGSEPQYISSGKTKLGTLSTKHLGLTYDDNKAYDSGFRDGASYGDNGSILVTSIEGNELLFRANDQPKKFAKVDLKTAQSVVETCVKSTADSSEYINDSATFQVFFKGEGELGQKVSSFSECLEKANKQVLLGYHYKLSVRDAVNGRIVSD